MYKIYVVPDATQLPSHGDIYSNMQLVWDPRSETDAYAVISPKLNEEINKAASLEFTILPSNIHYNDFHKRKSVVLVYDDNDLIFEGAVASAPVDFYKQRKITCSGTLSYLCDTIQAPDEQNEAVVPTSISGTTYVIVPRASYTNANPYRNEWYERSYNSSTNVWVYTRSQDTVANNNKLYYSRMTGSGTNYSGITYSQPASTNETVAAHISRILAVHNSQADPYKMILDGTINNEDGTEEFKSANFRTTWDALENDILDSFGRYFKMRTGQDGNLYFDYVNIDQMTGDESTMPVIEYTVNMLEMSEEDDSDDDIFTVLVPVGKDKLTVSDVSGHSSPEFDDGREVDPYIASFGGARRYIVVSRSALRRFGCIVKTVSFGDIEDPNELYDKAVKYIVGNYYMYSSYEVKAIDLHYLDSNKRRIAVGDKCRIRSQWHNVDTRNLYVISAERDLENPENDSFKIGIPSQDRDAANKRLTSKTNNTADQVQANNGYYGSGMSAMHSILEDYIKVTEWGLEIESNLRNRVETADGMNHTQFEQDAYHINLLAEKVFGAGDDASALASGFIKVPLEHYTDSSGNPKNPHNEHWYEPVINPETGEITTYILSTKLVADPNDEYYVQRLTNRLSDIDVGEGGIHARVNGIYYDTVAMSSWFEMNEKSIDLITGHIHVNGDGEVIIDSGAGLRTGHTERITATKMYKVPKSDYGENSPSRSGWYEMIFDSSGKWVGEGVSQSDIEANLTDYYVLSTDTVAQQNKNYFYRTYYEEELMADFGIFDENNLTAGVIARTVNHPLFIKIGINERQQGFIHGQSPQEQGWYQYNELTGVFELTTHTYPHYDVDYYKRKNDSTSFTDIMGNHIVIGRPDNYDGLSASMKAKVDNYISKNNLNGTITEVASDVLVTNALIAKFASIDNLDNITLHSSKVQVGGLLTAGHITISGSYEYGNLNNDGSLSAQAVSLGNITFVHGGSSFVENNADEVIMGFDDVTTEGDTVKIPYRTAGMSDFDENHVISFNKPASLGTVTWSSGNVDDTLVVKTAGDVTFFSARLTHQSLFVGGIATITYNRDGSNLLPSSSLLRNKPTLKATMQVSGTWTGESHDINEDDPVVWERDIYFDATQAYDDGRNVVKANVALNGPDSNLTDAESTQAHKITTPLGYNTYYKMYMTYDGAEVGGKTYFLTPSKPSAQGYTAADYKNVDYTDGGTISLAYSGQVTVRGKYKLSDSQTYSTATGITVKAPAKGVYRTYAKFGDTEYTSGTIALGYSGAVTVYGQGKTADDSDYVSATGIRITAPEDRYNAGKDYGAGTLTLSPEGTKNASYNTPFDVTATTTYANGTKNTKTLRVNVPADRYSTGKTDGANSLSMSPLNDTTLGYGASQTVTATTTKGDGTSVTKSVKITAPASNAPSASDISLPNSSSDIYTSSGNPGMSNVPLRFSSQIKQAFSNNQYFVFTVKCKDATKKYQISLT